MPKRKRITPKPAAQANTILNYLRPTRENDLNPPTNPAAHAAANSILNTLRPTRENTLNPPKTSASSAEVNLSASLTTVNVETCRFLISTFSDFLMVAIHAILYERAIYPPASFISARKFGLPVRRNRHPGVCKWIEDAVAAVEKEIRKGLVKRVVVVINSPDAMPLERFVFDVSSFPEESVEKLLAHFEAIDIKRGDSDKYEDERELDEDRVKVNETEVEEQLREALQKLASSSGKLKPLPKGCSFTVMAELRGNDNASTELPPAWMPSPLSLQTDGEDYNKRIGSEIGSDLGGVRSVPVRLVESRPFILEMWIEEGKAKLEGKGKARSSE